MTQCKDKGKKQKRRKGRLKALSTNDKKTSGAIPISDTVSCSSSEPISNDVEYEERPVSNSDQLNTIGDEDTYLKWQFMIPIGRRIKSLVHIDTCLLVEVN